MRAGLEKDFTQKGMARPKAGRSTYCRVFISRKKEPELPDSVLFQCRQHYSLSFSLGWHLL
jgi:hypothetical protein